MKLVRAAVLTVMTLGIMFPAFAQQPGQQDQVDRLAQMVGLNDGQQKEIRSIIDELQGEIHGLQGEVQQLQQNLQSQIKPEFDESAIRADAEKLGELTGEISALSTLMQAKVDSVFTAEQRGALEQRMQEMQQKMQQQRDMMQQQ